MCCRPMTAECGYLAYLQKNVAAHVAVSVFTLSLLQVSWMQELIGPSLEPQAHALVVPGLYSLKWPVTLKKKHLPNL